jgi:hypothetical protein
MRGRFRRRASVGVYATPPMTYRAIYAYAWDLADEGISAVLDRAAGLGLDTLSYAGAYHAGKFLRPHGKSGKVYFPEDGTIYFRADPARYGRVKPLPSRLIVERDILREAIDAGRLAVNAWLVLMHNSRLGALFPDLTVKNAFGDGYVYSLCPTHPEAREYAVALCKDVTDAYPVIGLSLETPGFMPYAHGYHHEFALVRQNRWLDNLLGLCFCDHCVRGAREAGIDAEAVQARVRRDVDAYLTGDLDFPDDMAEAFWLADIVSDGELAAYLRWRCGVVTSLVAEIREAVRADATVAVIPSVARPSGGAWYEGSDLLALAAAGATIEACFYEPSVARIRSDIADVQRRLGGTGRLRGILRPGHPDLTSREAVIGAVAALRSAGIDEIAFYNWGHLKDASLAWIGDALAEGRR